MDYPGFQINDFIKKLLLILSLFRRGESISIEGTHLGTCALTVNTGI